MQWRGSWRCYIDFNCLGSLTSWLPPFFFVMFTFPLCALDLFSTSDQVCVNHTENCFELSYTQSRIVDAHALILAASKPEDPSAYTCRAQSFAIIWIPESHIISSFFFIIIVDFFMFDLI
jgi:hypothetical protein